MKDFKFAQIVPVPHLIQIADNHYQMCLAHLVKESEEYARFYRLMSNEGKFVLMDNGAAENAQLTTEELIDMYKMINPTEIVLPDTLNNSNDTIRKTLNFLHEYGEKLPYRFMAVPQGKDFFEWAACANILLMEPRINSIGVSKFLNIATGLDDIRIMACQYIQALAKALGREREIEIHLLGCDEGPALVKEAQEAYPLVRGCDSAFAFLATQADAIIEECSQRPYGIIDFLEGVVDGSSLDARMTELESVTGVKNNKDGKQWR